MKKRIRSERDLYNWLFEQDQQPAPATGGSPATGDKPKANISDLGSITGKTNIADVDPKAIVAAMQNPEANPQILKIINDGQDKQYDAAAIKAFVAKIGPDELAKRIGEVGAKLPASGLPKDQMPFLPASDIKDWNDAKAISKMIDAVSPGGEYQIDWQPPYYDYEGGGEAKGATGQDAKTMQESVHRMLETGVKKLAEMLTEQEEGPASVPINSLQASPPASEEWLKAGMNDGKQGEDEPAVSYEDQAPLTISTMVPTQKNVLIGKTLNFAIGGFPKEGVPLGAYVVDAGKGTEILDGHHRWSAGYIQNPNMKLTGHLFKSKVPTNKLLPILTRLGNALGKQTKLSESVVVRRISAPQPSFDLARWQRLAGIKR